MTLSFSPRTPAQQHALDAYRENDVLFLVGPAGTGKTYLTAAAALSDVLNPFYFSHPRRKKVMVYRPCVEAGPSLGYLKGSLDEKLDPYKTPWLQAAEKLLGLKRRGRERENSKKNENPLDVKELFTFSSLGHLRGVNLEDCVAVLDEAQNCTYSQLKLFITRLCKGSKCVLVADPTQCDLRGGQGPQGFIDFMVKCSQVEGVGVVRLTEEDCVRHPVVQRLLQVL